MRKMLYDYVPYRLISPFYDVELRRISNTKPGLKNLTIMELSYSDEGNYQLGPGGALWTGKAGRGRD